MIPPGGYPPVEFEWDWNQALGDTIMEKFESLYLQILNAMKKIGQSRNESTKFFARRDITQIFEGCSVFESVHDPENKYVGKLGQFHIYNDPNIGHGCLKIAGRCGYAVITIKNFLI